MNKRDRGELLKYLRTQILMGVATKGEFLWSANVYYLVDDDLNFYFLSSPKSRHGINISKDPEVSLSIMDSRQIMSGDKVGVQMNGRCKRVKGMSVLKKVVSSWKKSPHIKNLPSIDLFKKATKTGIYKIEPKVIKYFNTKRYKDDFKEWKTN